MSRLRGFRDGMATHGLTVDEDLIAYATRYTVEEGARCCRELLARPGDFTAVAAANDMLAVGCYSALDERSLQCPEDISVIGFNDMPFIDRLRPPLTTVRFPHYQLGTEAAQLLLERISGKEGPVKILYLAPELVIRGSTAGRAVNPSVPHRIPGALGGPGGKRLLTGDRPRKRRSGSGDGPPVFTEAI
jgi:LacI family transcriptional regulator